MEIAEDLKNIDDKLIEKLNQIALNKIEYWDIRCSVNVGTSLDFTDQKSKEISSSEMINCGIRGFINGGWGFVVLKDLDRNSIIDGFSKAVKLARLTESLSKNKFKIKERDPLVKNFKVNSKQNLMEVDIEEKINLVKHHEKITSNFSPKIKNSRTVYVDYMSQKLFLNSFKSFILQELSGLRMFNLAYAQQNGSIQGAVNSVGGIGGFEISNTEKAINLSVKTAEESVMLLDAKSPIGGKFTVVMDPKLLGTVVHEAFGHAVEADIVLNKGSVLEEKINKQIAVEDVTIIDNPQMGQGKFTSRIIWELFCRF